MSYEWIEESGEALMSLEMFPYFDLANSAVGASMVRQHLGTEAKSFSRNHPMACWLFTMIAIFTGNILCNILLGDPTLGPLKNSKTILLTTGVWYFVFYTPFDVGYKLLNLLPVRVVLAVMKEIHRCKNIDNGVVQVSKLYPGAYLVMVLVGTMKGNGAGLSKLIERLIKGDEEGSPRAVEYFQPSLVTKSCLFASVMFVLDITTDLFKVSHSVIYFVVASFLIYTRVTYIMLDFYDPFRPVENMFCSVFFGEILDLLLGKIH